jgi:hypothetical protein
MLQNAGLDNSEVDGFLVGYEEAILKVQNMTVEIAREMLFFELNQPPYFSASTCL